MKRLILLLVPFATFLVSCNSGNIKTPEYREIRDIRIIDVGLLQTTAGLDFVYYNPNNFPERAITRRNVVLSQMRVNGVIDSLTLDSLNKLPLNLSYQRNTDSEGIALYFRNHLRPILLDWCQNHT